MGNRTVREILNDRENVEILPHVVYRDEFVASGVEIAYESVDVLESRKVLNRGRIEVLNVFTVKGIVKNEGVIRIGGV